MYVRLHNRKVSLNHAQLNDLNYTCFNVHVMFLQRYLSFQSNVGCRHTCSLIVFIITPQTLLSPEGSEKGLKPEERPCITTAHAVVMRLNRSAPLR